MHVTYLEIFTFKRNDHQIDHDSLASHDNIAHGTIRRSTGSAVTITRVAETIAVRLPGLYERSETESETERERGGEGGEKAAISLAKAGLHSYS